jgi:hypothetical protein
MLGYMGATVFRREESLQAAAREFDEWSRDWRTTASSGVFRRDYRIILGVSRRRSADDTPDPTPVDPALPQPPAVH